MSFMRYELSGLIRDEEARTFAGTQRDTGRPVFLHLVTDPARLDIPDLHELIGRAVTAGVVLESGNFANTRYLVTDPIEPFRGIVSWLQEIAPQLPERETPAPASSPVDEFEARIALRRKSAGQAPRLPGSHKPGEFTSMFRSGRNPAKPAPPPPENRGEFTGLLVTGAKPAKPSAPSAPANRAEFTGVFANARTPLSWAPLRPHPPEAATELFDTAQLLAAAAQPKTADGEPSNGLAPPESTALAVSSAPQMEPAASVPQSHPATGPRAKSLVLVALILVGTVGVLIAALIAFLMVRHFALP